MEDPERKLKADALHDETAPVDSHQLVPKLDPQGFPLRPQPSDDPRGTNPYHFGAAMTCADAIQIP
jgi:hypothetical protein